MASRIRLLLADDSALMRRQLREIFEAEGDFDLAFARTGLEVLEQVRLFRPDVVTLDINMPELDGIGCLRRLMRQDPRPVVMFSSLTQEGAATTMKALELGAVDFVPKPDGTVSLSIERVRRELLAKVRAAAGSRPRRTAPPREPAPRPPRPAGPPAQAAPRPSPPGGAPAGGALPGAVLIGISTGGPRTLEEVLPLLPADFPWPVLVAQHMPASFTATFAQRLDTFCPLAVREVQAVTPVLPGHIYIGRGDSDLVLGRRLGRVVAQAVPPDSCPWHPSADRLVATAMEVLPAEALIGVLMTGMGWDGATAMAALCQQGGRTIAESEDSAVVFGMPQELIRRHGATAVLPATAVAETLLRWVSPEPKAATARGLSLPPTGPLPKGRAPCR